MPQRRFFAQMAAAGTKPATPAAVALRTSTLGVGIEAAALVARNGGVNIMNPTLSDQINATVNAQRDTTQSDINKFQYYPVVSIGLAYRF